MATKTENAGFFTRRSGVGRFDIKDVLTYAYLLIGTVVMFGPVLWLVMSSFKDEALLFEQNPTFLPYSQLREDVRDVSIVEFNPDFFDFTINGVEIPEPDMEATNGFIYPLDEIMLTRSQRSQVEALAANTESADLSLLPEGADRVRLEGDTGNALQLLQAERDFSILVELLNRSELSAGLEAESITVFAPTDDAFEALILELGEPTVALLMQESDLLSEILASHVLIGAYSYTDLYLSRETDFTTMADGVSKTLDVDFGTPLPLFDITFYPLQIGDATLTQVNLDSDQGLLHVIDQVLVDDATLNGLSGSGDVSVFDVIPDTVTLESDPSTYLELAQSTPELTIFATVLETSEITLEAGDYTLLAPSNKAFLALIEQYGAETVASLLLPENQETLQSILQGHVLTDNYRDINLYRDWVGGSVETLSGELPVQMIQGETIRLAQVGSPLGANFNMIDPENPSDGILVVSSYITPTGNSAVFEPVREVSFKTENYTGALDAFDFPRYLYNTVFVTAVATVMTLLINSMAAFALSKYRFRGRDAVLLIIISTLMVPVSVILVPAFVVVSRLGMTNSLWGIIIPAAATPTGVFLLRQYMLTIPDELLDAARIDGASEWRIYWQVVLPLARPALAVLAIFSIMWRWNDFLWPLIVLSRSELFTLQVGLNAFQGALDVQWHYILAMTVLTLLPITIVFGILQRYITTGIATTGLK